MYALADIRYSAEFNGGIAEQIAAGPPADSLNAAFLEIYQVSGIKPRVLRTDGGARTKLQCDRRGLSWTISDHWEGAWIERGRAAVDIDNQREIRNKIGDAKFESIMRNHGWENVTVTGDDFPQEPWHFATRKSWLAGLDIEPLTEGAIMTATVPVKYTNAAGAVEKARYRPTPAGGVIDRTTSDTVSDRWKREINYVGDSITSNAKTYLADWAARIIADKAAFKALLADEVAKVTVGVDEAAIAAELLAHGIDFPSVAEIAQAVREEIIAPD